MFGAMTGHIPLAIACSLGPADFTERLQECQTLFATSLRESHREPRLLHLRLDPAVAREQDVRDLLKREQECCPFFSFSVVATPDALLLEAAVPEDAVECLNDLERLATGAPTMDP
jgi:hypothetical protein